MRVTRLGENRSSGFFLDRKTDRQQIRGRWRLASFQRRVFHTTFDYPPVRYFFFVSFSSTSLKRTCANKFSRAMIEEHRAIDVYSCQSSKKIYFLSHISIPLPFERLSTVSALNARRVPMMIIIIASI